MKNKALIILAIVFFQLAAVAQRRYVLDVKRSKILWKLETMGKHNGYILFKSGTLNYTNQAPVNGMFLIDMNSIHSLDGTEATIKRVERELRTPNFLDVAKYPSSNIVVKQVLATKNPQLFQVSANLTIKGITQSVSFIANLKKIDKGVVASANLKIDRRKWHIAYKPKNADLLTTWKDKLLQEDIEIDLRLMFKE